MKSVILLNIEDIENVSECCFGKSFNIVGVNGKTFTTNSHGYVFEREKEKTVYNNTPYFLTSAAVQYILR